MNDRVKLKMKCRHGLARIHVILILLVALLLAAAAVPGYRAYKYHADWLLCADSLRVVNGALTVDYLTGSGAKNLTDTEDALVSILPGRDGYCPTGGTVYFVKQKDGTWKAVCGEHDSDHALRTRLNASYVLTQLKDALRRAQIMEDEPERLEVQLNGRTMTCLLVEKETGIRRGTSTTKGYSGTVILYGIAGRGAFDRNNAKAGEICYLCFADEDHSATWRAKDGWGGSAYGDRY